LRSQLHALREIHFVTMSESDFVPPDKGLSDVLSLSSDTECTSVAIVEKPKKVKRGKINKKRKNASSHGSEQRPKKVLKQSNIVSKESTSTVVTNLELPNAPTQNEECPNAADGKKKVNPIVKPSGEVWTHIEKEVDKSKDQVVFNCRYCTKKWDMKFSEWKKKGSATSNYLRHVRDSHKKTV